MLGSGGESPSRDPRWSSFWGRGCSDCLGENRVGGQEAEGRGAGGRLGTGPGGFLEDAQQSWGYWSPSSSCPPFPLALLGLLPLQAAQRPLAGPHLNQACHRHAPAETEAASPGTPCAPTGTPVPPTLPAPVGGHPHGLHTGLCWPLSNPRPHPGLSVPPTPVPEPRSQPWYPLPTVPVPPIPGLATCLAAPPSTPGRPTKAFTACLGEGGIQASSSPRTRAAIPLLRSAHKTTFLSTA